MKMACPVLEAGGGERFPSPSQPAYNVKKEGAHERSSLHFLFGYYILGLIELSSRKI